jgi:predicted phage-related endonuclease
MAIPGIERDKAKEDMIFERLEEWNWSLIHDKPPTMAGVAPKLAMESLAKIYGSSVPALPTVEFPSKYEKPLRKIIDLQGKISDCKSEIKKYESEVEAHSVRIAELMKNHEHGVLTTTADKILIDFATKKSKRTDTSALKRDYPTIYDSVVSTSESRKLKVSVQPL